MIPFSPPRIDQLIIDEVVDTLKSGWITTGPKTKAFEKMLTQFCGNQTTICLNSATAGLELMLRWYGVQEGDEVILPAYTYSATANVVMHVGAKPVFVDVGPDFNMDVEAVRAAITAKTKVIMPVDFGGWPCDYDSLNACAGSDQAKKIFSPRTEEQKKLGRILVLADAAHSLGAIYKGKKSGALTDISVFSFHAVKNLTTAEGGAIALNLPAPFDNAELYAALCIKSLHGQTKDALSKLQKGNWRYDIVEPGYKMNMTDILASIGIVELKRYERDTLPRRKAICNSYNEHFRNKNWAILPLQEKKSGKGMIESSYHLYPLRIKGVSEQVRDKIMDDIFNKEVSVNVHFIPLAMTSFYSGLGYKITDYPVTYSLYENEISLPVYYDLDEKQIAEVVKAVEFAVEKNLKTEPV